MAALACVLGQFYNLLLYSETPFFWRHFNVYVITGMLPEVCVVHSCNSLHCPDVRASCRFWLHLRCYCGTMLMVGFFGLVCCLQSSSSPSCLRGWVRVTDSTESYVVLWLCTHRPRRLYSHSGWTSCSYQLFPFSCRLQAAHLIIPLDCYYSTTLTKSYNILRQDITTWVSPLCLFVLKGFGLWIQLKDGVKL